MLNNSGTAVEYKPWNNAIPPSSPDYLHTINLQYWFSLLPREAPRRNIPALHGLDELASRVNSFIKGVRDIEGQDTRVFIEEGDNKLDLRVETNVLYRALGTLFKAAGIPICIYGNPDVMEDREAMTLVEGLLNLHGHTMQFGRFKGKTGRLDRIATWLSSPNVRPVYRLRS